MLVDSGSSITIVQFKFFTHLTKLLGGVVNPTSISVRSVNGNSLTVHGSAVMQFKLGELVVSHKVILADIVPDVILGLDFLRQHACIINYDRIV